jgi:DNA-binding XRE family transcriptional regulator
MLKIMRLLYGYTQAELAARIGKKQNYYTQIESGKVQFSRYIAKLADILKVREAFLTSQSEYPDYPFTSNFYIFCLCHTNMARFFYSIADLVCSHSSKIDAVFMNVSPLEMKFKSAPVQYVVLRDIHDTIFLIKKPARRKTSQVDIHRGKDVLMENDYIPNPDIFRIILHSRSVVHEKTIITPHELEDKIRRGTATRNDFVQLFSDQWVPKYRI